MGNGKRTLHAIGWLTLMVMWLLAVGDMLFVNACRTDPLFRLLEAVFAFILVPLIMLAMLENGQREDKTASTRTKKGIKRI